VNDFKTRSTRTVHTSAKAVLPVSRSGSERILTQIRDPDRQQNLIICSLAHCQRSLKISRKSVRSFFAKLLTDRQTDKQVRQQDAYPTTRRPLGQSSPKWEKLIADSSRTSMRSFTPQSFFAAEKSITAQKLSIPITIVWRNNNDDYASSLVDVIKRP